MFHWSKILKVDWIDPKQTEVPQIKVVDCLSAHKIMFWKLS